jgi:hypothetical protein
MTLIGPDQGGFLLVSAPIRLIRSIRVLSPIRFGIAADYRRRLTKESRR